MAPRHDRADEILTPQALAFVAALHREFDARRRQLLERRKERQAALDAGGTLDFLARDRRHARRRLAAWRRRRRRSSAAGSRSPGPPPRPRWSSTR